MKRILAVSTKRKSLFHWLVKWWLYLYMVKKDDDPYANVDMTPDPTGKNTGDVNDR